MRIQLFADYYVIERGVANRSYFAFCVDGDKNSWTKRISQAQRYRDIEAARDAVKRIEDRQRRK